VLTLLLRIANALGMELSAYAKQERGRLAALACAIGAPAVRATTA